MKMTNTIHAAIAGNLTRLMEYHDNMSQATLAIKAGVSQKTVSNLLNPGSVASIRTDSIEKVATYFRIQPYHLMIPDLPIEELISKRIEKVVECYAQSLPDGRENIKRIAENEVRYCVTEKTGTHD